MLTHTLPAELNDGLIAIRCNQPDLRTSLLAQLITDRMRINCRILTLEDHSRHGELLSLFDCQQHSVNNLRNWFKRPPPIQYGSLCALFNVPNRSHYESLIEWPNVKGIFPAPLSEEKLMQGITHLLTGDFWLPRHLLHRFLEENRRPPRRIISTLNLTRREKQILTLICESATNAAIADELHVSEHTVKSHLYNVYKKIGVKNRLEACNWARDFLQKEYL
jgi:LuxR family transcriptional regulator, positive regulator of biofilm formation